MDAIAQGRLDADLKVVVSDKPGAMALERARAAGVPACVVERGSFPDRRAFDAELVRVLQGYGVELVVLAGFMRILGEGFIEAFRWRVINIHPSLLPAFPGLSAQRQALEYGVKVTGCTVHFVDEGLDSGPIILQAAVPVMENDTVESLSARILEQEHRILPAAIQLYAEGRLRISGRRVRIESRMWGGLHGSGDQEGAPECFRQDGA